MHRPLGCSIALIVLVVLSLPDTGAAVPVRCLGAAEEFVILGLGGDLNVHGELIINSATSIIGRVGYGAYIDSTTNKKVDLFEGEALVHSKANFSYTPATFNPTGGILTGPAVDAKLDQATADALAASAMFAGMAATHTLPALGDDDSVTVVSTGAVNVISLPSLNYKSDTLTIESRPGFEDCFVFNVAGDFKFAQSNIVLTGTRPSYVLFNFLDPDASISIYKAESVFYGTILAPGSTVDVEYHNPATFEGAIIAYNINLHSDFNIKHESFVPEPSTLLLACVGGLAALKRRVKIRRGRP